MSEARRVGIGNGRWGGEFRGCSVQGYGCVKERERDFAGDALIWVWVGRIRNAELEMMELGLGMECDVWGWSNGKGLFFGSALERRFMAGGLETGVIFSWQKVSANFMGLRKF